MYDISVIVPVYNASKTINRCLDSIINQTFKNINIIVVNDGSTDNTLEIIKKYSNIKVYNKKHEGIGLTRNYCIKKCNTKYFMFVDADDYLEKDAIMNLYNKIVNSEYDFVMGSINNKFDKEIKLDNTNKYDYIFNNEIPYFMTPWNKLYKTSIFDNNIYIDLKKCEDEYAIYRILKNVNKGLFIPIHTYNYSDLPNSLSKNNKYYLDILYAFKDRINFFKNTKYEKICIKRYLNLQIELFCKFKKDKICKKDIIDNFKEYKGFNIKYLFFKYFPNMYYKLYLIKERL